MWEEIVAELPEKIAAPLAPPQKRNVNCNKHFASHFKHIHVCLWLLRHHSTRRRRLRLAIDFLRLVAELSAAGITR